jgi:hypothetical protein
MSYIGNVPTTAAFPFDQFSGNGSTTAFTLSYAPAGASSIIVSISGVVQNPNTYSINGTTLTFTPAPPTGTNNIAVLYLGLPVVATTTPGNTAYFSSSVFTATASQTVFTPSGTYQAGFINVIRNGAQLAPADYTATNGTTVTLADACTAGDVVVIEVFNLTSISGALPLTGGTVTGATTFNAAVTGTSFSTSLGTLYPIVNGTAITTLSATPQTAPAFTDIPSWAKKVTVMFQAIRTSSTGVPLIQLGTGSTPTYTTSGYVCTATRLQDSSAVSVSSLTSGFFIASANSTNQLHGSLILTNLTGNTWVAQGNFSNTTTTNFVFVTAGSIALGAALTAVRLFIDGSQTFNNGTINILWE